MVQEALLWEFRPKYLPNTEVWWASHVLKKGVIKGLIFSFYKDESTYTRTIFYSVETRSGEITRMYEMHEDLLFESREALLTHLEKE